MDEGVFGVVDVLDLLELARVPGDAAGAALLVDAPSDCFLFVLFRFVSSFFPCERKKKEQGKDDDKGNKVDKDDERKAPSA